MTKYFDKVFVTNEEWLELIAMYGAKLTHHQILNYLSKTHKAMPEYEQMLWDIGVEEYISNQGFALKPNVRYAWQVGRVPLYESLFNTLERNKMNGKHLGDYLNCTSSRLQIHNRGSCLQPFVKHWLAGNDLDFDVTFTQLQLM